MRVAVVSDLMEGSHFRVWHSLFRRLLAAITVVASVACADGPSEPEAPATLSLDVTPTSATVVQGGSVEVTGTAVVGGSFTGSTAITVLDLPEGVDGLVGGPTTSGSTTTVPVTITASSGVSPGTYTITVRASGSGVTDEATLTLTVTAAPRYTLEVLPTALSVEQGTSGTAAISLARTNFTQEVSLAAENAPSGMHVAFDPATVGGDAAEVTVSVGESVAQATYDLTIRGEAPGLTDQTALLQVTVTAASEASYSLSVVPDELTLEPAQTTAAEGSGPAAVSDADVTVRIARINGHTDAVTLELTGHPEGVSATFEPSSVSGDESTLSVAVGSTVSPGEYVTTVRGHDGVLPERTAQLLLLVNPTPTYQLLPDPSTLTLEQGTRDSTVIALSRVDFEGDVTLSLEGSPTGLTGSFTPNPVTGDVSTLTLEADGSVSPGDYELTIRGTTGELADRTGVITVSVREAEGFSLEPISDITLGQGASDSRPVTVTRTGGFTGEVAFGVTPAVAGLSMVVDPTSTTGNSATLTATVSQSLSTGTYSLELTGSAAGEPVATAAVDVTVTATATEVTVHPAAIDDVLYNPGMGFVDSHFAYGYQYPEGTFVSYDSYLNPPPYPDPTDYPPSTVAYFRWCWREVEPVEGQIDFERFDAIVANAAERSEGERAGFRIITVDDDPECVPDWLRSKPGYVGFEVGRHVPDYSNPVFLEAFERLYNTLGARYDGRLDHIDLGGVGCWGEWNSACLTDRPHLCDVLGQSDSVCLETLERVIDIQMDPFPNTPRIMLGKGEGVLGDAMDHALARGAGWRVDCFGDWGIFGPDWNHHTDAYPQVVSRVGDAWQRGPVHMEVCFTMPHMYYEFDMSPELVQETFDWALDNHISVFNGKSTPIPDVYWPIVEDFLKRAGYRLAVASATHASSVGVGQDFLVDLIWANVGVAPPYAPYQVALRLRNAADEAVVQAETDTDVRTWLPGEHTQEAMMVLPSDLPAGSYSLDVAILTQDGARPAIDLAIEGRRSDGWYELSNLDVVAPSASASPSGS